MVEGTGCYFIELMAGSNLHNTTVDTSIIDNRTFNVSEVIPDPSGGTVIDVEARLAITDVLDKLQTIGILE